MTVRVLISDRPLLLRTPENPQNPEVAFNIGADGPALLIDLPGQGKHVRVSFEHEADLVGFGVNALKVAGALDLMARQQTAEKIRLPAIGPNGLKS
jgi:hypothetical protein